MAQECCDPCFPASEASKVPMEISTTIYRALGGFVQMLLWPWDTCDRWKKLQEISSPASKGRRPQQWCCWHRWAVHCAWRKEAEDKPGNMQQKVRFMIQNGLVGLALSLSWWNKTCIQFSATLVWLQVKHFLIQWHDSLKKITHIIHSSTFPLTYSYT